MNNVSVLIGTCDSYSQFWKNFDILFKRYWKPKTKNYLVSETKTFDDDHYITCTPGVSSWGKRMNHALRLIDTEYTIFVLEDYYFSLEISDEYIQTLIDKMDKYHADKCMFASNCSYYTLEVLESNLYRFKQNSMYLTSIQPSVWKTDLLRKLMVDSYSPWDFELVGTPVLAAMNKCILLDIKNEVYFNMVRRGGQLSVGWQDFLKKEGLTL